MILIFIYILFMCCLIVLWNDFERNNFCYVRIITIYNQFDDFFTNLLSFFIKVFSIKDKRI